MIASCSSLRELTLEGFVSPGHTQKPAFRHTIYQKNWVNITKLCIIPYYREILCQHLIYLTIDLLASYTIVDFEYNDPTYYSRIGGTHWPSASHKALLDLRKGIISQAIHFTTFSFTHALFSCSFLDPVISCLSSCHRVSLHRADFSSFSSIIIPGVQYLKVVGCFEHLVPDDDDLAELRALILSHAGTLRALGWLDFFEAFAFSGGHTPDAVLERLIPLIQWGKAMGFDVTYAGPQLHA